MCFIDFHSFFIIYVFEVKESISDNSAELPCSGDFETPGLLPVQKVLRGTDDFVLGAVHKVCHPIFDDF